MSQLRGKKVLVTGGAGFLGRHVVAELEKYVPARVVVPRSKDWDLTDRTACRHMLQLIRPDVVIHLAAVCGGIGANQAAPGKFLFDNAIMGLQLMEEARLHGVTKWVGIGSVCSYPKHCPVPFREETLWDGYPEETNAPYGLAKRMLLAQARAYCQQYGFNAITLIPVNLYGPRDNFDLQTSHVIPALIRKAVEAREAGASSITLWGTGQASREFLYVTDAAVGIVVAADRYDEGEPINLGTGTEVTVEDLAYLVCEACHFDGVVRWDATRPDGQPRRCLDVSRAGKVLGWQAKISLRDGLLKTIAWYEEQRVRDLEAVMTNWP